MLRRSNELFVIEVPLFTMTLLILNSLDSVMGFSSLFFNETFPHENKNRIKKIFKTKFIMLSLKMSSRESKYVAGMLILIGY